MKLKHVTYTADARVGVAEIAVWYGPFDDRPPIILRVEYPKGMVFWDNTVFYINWLDWSEMTGISKEDKG